MAFPAGTARPRSRWTRVLRAAPLLIALLEVLIFIGLFQLIGWWTLLALLALSAVGALVISRTSRRAFKDFREMGRTGRAPDRKVSNDVITLVGGGLLLVPGFVTAAMGVFLILPFTRAMTRRLVGFLAARQVLKVRVNGTPVTFGRPVVPGEVVDQDMPQPPRPAQTPPGGAIEGRIVDEG